MCRIEERVMNTPLHNNKFLNLFFYFFEGTYLRLENLHKGESIPRETLHVSKLLNMVNFSMNTTYTQPILWI